METNFRLSNRVQWSEFVICLLLFLVPIIVLCVLDNLYSDLITAPIAIVVIVIALLLSIVSIVWRKRGRILIIDGPKWTMQHEKSGKTLMEFNLSLPHSFALAIRQGIVGRSPAVYRWLQVFLAQNGKILRIEAPYMESTPLKGLLETERCAQIGALANKMLKQAAGKPYTYDETEYFRERKKVGNAVHGLSSFMEGLSEELVITILEAADNSLGPNKFLTKMNELRNSQISFSVFKNDFLENV